MLVVEWRFDVQLISPDAFAGYMKYRDFTVRGLAEAVREELIKTRSSDTCSPSLIGHLRSGRRKTCRPDVAKAIEKRLQAPPNSLFVPGVSRVSRERPAA